MSQTLPEKVRWTTADLDLLAADEWKRYERAIPLQRRRYHWLNGSVNQLW
jgi:hypothetical protein